MMKKSMKSGLLFALIVLTVALLMVNARAGAATYIFQHRCVPHEAIPGEVVTISGNLMSDGAGVGGKTIQLSYAPSSSTWGDPTGPWEDIGTGSTDATTGLYSFDWTVPGDLELGYYVIKAEFEGDSEYDRCNATTGMHACIHNIVVNGGFEEPVVTHAKNWNIYNSTEIPGWHIEWMPGPDMHDGYPRPADAYIELQRETFGSAAEGHQWAELDADWDGPPRIINFEPASIRIYQDLPTVAGGVYRLSFAFSPRPGVDDNKLEVKWDGAVVAILEANGTTLSNTNWTYHQYVLTATSTTTRLEFADLSASDTLGTFLDDVCVDMIGPNLHIVPETLLGTIASLTSMLLGLAMVAFYKKHH